MNIQFTDRKTFKEAMLYASEDCNMISISSCWNDHNEMVHKLAMIGRAEDSDCYMFLDIDSDESGFDILKAEAMYNTINTWMNLDYSQKPSSILIHCDMGVSRSGAVAKWINDYYGLDDRYLNEYNCYNTYIYQMLMKAAGVDLKSWYESQQGEIE
tara:strand:- start:53740 stop:54207 length:468 start_codon:yes stop_codon:yes gene_type:complete